jgi:hypothetical protein
MAFDATRTLRGALAGAAAAAVWAAQQPLDKRVFGVDYDDAELLGRLARVRPPATHPVGLALHVANGAAFGALYANVAPSLPGPGAARGAAAGLAEHLATWPGTLVIDRLSLGRDFPKLWGDPRAFAQATWRHLLFGVTLGELERRLNPPADEPASAYEDYVSTNGHRDLEEVVSAAGRQT